MSAKARIPERVGDVVLVEYVDGTARFALVVRAYQQRAFEVQRFDGRYEIIRRMYRMRPQPIIALKDTEYAMSPRGFATYGTHPSLQRVFASTKHALRALAQLRQHQDHVHASTPTKEQP